MTNLLSMLHFQVPFKYHRSKSFPAIIPTTKFQTPDFVPIQKLTRTISALHNSNSVKLPRRSSVSNALKFQFPEYCCGDKDEIIHILKRWVEFIRRVFPGGSWWRLADKEREIGSSPIEAKPMTVLRALSQMWTLISDEKGVLYTSFGALTIAALSEISMPGIITDSVFSAVNGETLMFYRKSQLLLFLCLTSGICSGLRSGCFAIANTILVKRLREAVFSSIVLQDMAFFDSEAVGDLTSRIGADCQRLSRTIGNDIHLIMRNILQNDPGGMSILSGNVSAEQLTKYVLYCEWLIYAAWRIQDNMSSLLQSIGACEKVLQLMRRPPSGQFLSKGVELQELTGCIEFTDVSFHYSSRNTAPVLKSVNISIQSNEVVAIVGASGSGKSTLIKLMLRLYEPISGEIYINGIPLGELDIRWLREKTGYVEQESHIFRSDINSNISYGCFRSISQEEIESAASKVYAHEFISGLPSGYDTIIDDNLLSGGQKQRIAIARAILKDPEILVLDEATSSLDAENEGYIKDVLHSLKKDSKKRTIIIIAHRLSTIEVADKILVMDNGQIVETGNHSELLQRNGEYARLFKLRTDSRSLLHHQEKGLAD